VWRCLSSGVFPRRVFYGGGLAPALVETKRRVERQLVGIRLNRKLAGRVGVGELVERDICQGSVGGRVAMGRGMGGGLAPGWWRLSGGWRGRGLRICCGGGLGLGGEEGGDVGWGWEQERLDVRRLARRFGRENREGRGESRWGRSAGDARKRERDARLGRRCWAEEVLGESWERGGGS